MNRFAPVLFLTGCVLTAARAMDLKQSKFTQVVNEVQVISASDKSTKTAVVNSIFSVPDILRTGPNSRAELVADDQTITRVGANTVFSFDPANRTIDLQKGSLLFHSPKGRGGGTVRTGAATASVLGTTIAVTTTPDGGFKILVLEGRAEVKFLNGLAQHLSAGQMTFVLPGGGISPIIVFRLDANTKGSKLINGFNHPLPSWNKIEDEINNQTRLIQKGRAQDTGLIVGDKATASQVQALDPSVIQNYFNHLTTYQPLPSGRGYLSIDGFLVEPHSLAEPASDALFPAWALSVNSDVTSANLNAFHTFASTGPFDITLPGQDVYNHFLANPFSGYFARNINFKTRSVDLTPFSSFSSFNFLAAQNLILSGSLDFIASPLRLNLTAGGQILLAPGSTLSDSTGNLRLNSFGSMHFNNANILTSAGSIQLNTLSDLSLVNGSIHSAYDSFFSASQGITINGTQIQSDLAAARLSSDSTILLNNATLNGGIGVQVFGNDDVTANNCAISAPGATASLTSFSSSLYVNGGTVTANYTPLFANNDVNISGAAINAATVYVNAGGSITMNAGAAIAAATVTLNAGDGILLDNVTMTASSPSSSLNIMARNTASLGSATHTLDLTSFTALNITAHTINLLNVSFGAGSNPNLTCATGNWAFNSTPLPGYVNFLGGVTYGGVLVTSANQSTYINPASGSGFHIYGGAP